MHYYLFNIGDYVADTAHLSWDEDHALRLLLDLYYKQEAPLPADRAQIARLMRISAPSRLRVIENVLREFFTLTERGWENKRCEAEIARTGVRRAAASAGANARWSKEGRAARPAAASSGRSPARAAPDESLEDGGDGGYAAGCGASTSAQCDRIESASPPHREGNAPIPIPIPIPKPNPTDAPAAAHAAHDHAPARSAAGGARAAAGLAPMEREDQGRRQGGAGGAPAAHPPAAPAVTAIADPPASVGDWHNFFSQAGFAARPLLKPQTRALFAQWAGRGITQARMREAMERARALGESPNSPAYYAWIIDGESRGGVPARKTLASALHRIVQPAVLPPPVERL